MNNPEIIHEDNHLMVIDKPCCWLVQGDKTRDRTLTDWMIDYIKKKYNKPGNVFCHPCHRIDRPVGGLIIFAKTSKALKRLNQMFKGNMINKKYLAIVGNTPTNLKDTLVHWFEKNPHTNTTKAYKYQKKNTSRGQLSYKLVASHGMTSLLEIKPESGKPHQIRVQLKSIGCPIKGDIKYGYPKANPDKSIDLHAFRLEFIHPVRKHLMRFQSIPKWESYKTFLHELD